MFKLPPAYRIPLLIALGLHVILIICLMINLPQARTLLPSAQSAPKIVQAKAVNQAQIKQAMAKIKSAERHKRLREIERVKRLQRAAAAAKRARRVEERRLRRLAAHKRLLAKQAKAAKEKILAEKRRQRTLARQRALAKKRAKEQREAKMKALAAKNKALQQKLMQQQLNSEQSQVKQQLQNAKLQRLLNRYIGQVKAAVHDHWNKPKELGDHQAVTLSLNLAPGGVVIQAKIAKSSGNPVFDRSAVVAVYKASPLPVPKNPALFDKFRHIDFTFNP
jgi:colicin import membrane protein